MRLWAEVTEVARLRWPRGVWVKTTDAAGSELAECWAVSAALEKD